MSRLVHGFGVNDADYAVKPRVNGKQVACPAYRTWANMIQRAYNPKEQEKYPTYIGVKVCEEWRHFMAFRSWWLANNVPGWHLDKDLIGNRKLYSPRTCIFVPDWLNNFTIDSGASRGEWPIGVSWHKLRGRFQANCRHPFGRQEHLGLFDCPEHAHLAWLVRKLEIAAEIKPQMDEIDIRIYPRVVDTIRNAS